MKAIFYTFVLSTFLFATAQAESELNLDKVLAEYAEAKGGIDTIKNIKTMKAVGTMSMGAMEFPLKVTIKRPNKVYTEFEAQGMKGVQAYDGETGWAIMPFMGKPDPEKMADDQLKQIQDQADMDGPLIDYKAKGNTVELIGETDIEGTPVIELKVTKKNGDVMQFFLDKEYKLEVMTRAKMDMMGQQIEAETYYSDYNEVGDTVMPHAMTIKMNGVEAQNLTFQTMEVNMEVADDLFTMPEVMEKAKTSE